MEQQSLSFGYGNLPSASMVNQLGGSMETEDDLMDDSEASPPLKLEQKLHNLIVEHLVSVVELLIVKINII